VNSIGPGFIDQHDGDQQFMPDAAASTSRQIPMGAWHPVEIANTAVPRADGRATSPARSCIPTGLHRVTVNRPVRDHHRDRAVGLVLVLLEGPVPCGHPWRRPRARRRAAAPGSRSDLDGDPGFATRLRNHAGPLGKPAYGRDHEVVTRSR
jgi:hypothetical protein